GGPGLHGAGDRRRTPRARAAGAACREDAAQRSLSDQVHTSTVDVLAARAPCAVGDQVVRSPSSSMITSKSVVNPSVPSITCPPRPRHGLPLPHGGAKSRRITAARELPHTLY